MYRPAAIEQLGVLAKSSEIECFPSDTTQKPLDIALTAREYALKHYFDVLIIDTAGRLSIDEFMIEIGESKESL